MSEVIETTQPEQAVRKDQVTKVKELGRTILAANAELESLPREALIEAAWQGIAHYHVEGTVWGYESESVKAFEKEKELRVSLLTDVERERAIFLASDWLDDNFNK